MDISVIIVLFYQWNIIKIDWFWVVCLQVPPDHIAYRYEVLELLGKGSFGPVSKCLDHKTNEMVAVKIIQDMG